MNIYKVETEVVFFVTVEVEADTLEKAEELQVKAFCNNTYGFSHEGELEVNVGEVNVLGAEHIG